jgi:uncharacterized protein (TIGR00297 family)
VRQREFRWQSKTILLLVLPAVAVDVLLEAHWWATQMSQVAIWTLGLSALLGLAAWGLRSATPGAALTGAAITASLMFSTVTVPYYPWHTALVPVAVLLVLTSLSTRLGRSRKEQLGTAEYRTGRTAAQVAANLGAAALLSTAAVQTYLLQQSGIHFAGLVPASVFAVGLAALCEAAADTVSSELGQLLSGTPRMITTLRVAEPGTDGAISLGGSAAGILAAGVVAVAGTVALGGDRPMFAVSWIAGTFGLFFDSLLGATLERRGWLGNNGVNFLSTLSAAAFALILLAILGLAHA